MNETALIKITLREITNIDGRWSPENGRAYFYFTLVRQKWELVSWGDWNNVDTLHEGYISHITVNPYPHELVELLILDSPDTKYDRRVLTLLPTIDTDNEMKWEKIDDLNRRANALDGTRP